VYPLGIQEGGHINTKILSLRAAWISTVFHAGFIRSLTPFHVILGQWNNGKNIMRPI